MVWLYLIVVGWLGFVFGHFLLTAVAMKVDLHPSAMYWLLEALLITACLAAVIAGSSHLLGATPAKYFLVPAAILVQGYIGMNVWWFLAMLAWSIVSHRPFLPH